MFSFKAGAALAVTLMIFAAGIAHADEIDVAYSDPSCLSVEDYAGLTGRRLASVVGADVAANPLCARNACLITPAERAVGAGLAQAFQQFAGAGDEPAAGTVADAGCSCGGPVTGAFVSSVGGQVCDIANGSEASYGGAGAVGSLFYIRAAGGGGGTPQSPN